MHGVSIADSLTAPEVEVELWGALFTVVPVTRTRQKAIQEIERELNDLDETVDQTDKAVELMAPMRDQLLVPQQGKRKTASAHIIEKWNADELSYSQLEAFIKRLGMASRPT